MKISDNNDLTALFFTVDCILAALNAGFAVYSAARGTPLCLFSAVACGVSVYGAVDMLRYRKKRKRLMEEHERTMQWLDALRVYYENVLEESRRASPYLAAYTAPKRGKIFYLATKHRKARVRKKNIKRLKRGDGQ